MRRKKERRRSRDGLAFFVSVAQAGWNFGEAQDDLPLEQKACTYPTPNCCEHAKPICRGRSLPVFVTDENIAYRNDQHE
jgi:hypothetical protein